MTDALIVAGDEALDLARRLAERSGTSIDEAVVESLRSALDRLPPRSQAIESTPAGTRTEEQQARYEALMALAHAVSANRLPGARSNHDDLYDANGLPV